MEETLIWAGGLAIEALLAITVVLIVLLRRSRKAQQQLVAELASKETHVEEADTDTGKAAEAAPVPATEAAAAEAAEATADAQPEQTATQNPEDDEELADPSSSSLSSELEELREIIDDAKIVESTDELRQRLDATHQSLQRLAVDLDQEVAQTGEPRVSIEPLQQNLKDMTSEVDSLRVNNAQLQQDLRSKVQDMERSVADEQETTVRALNEAKQLQEAMGQLRDKLKDKESHVQQLQTANEGLTAEYDALMKEYERIYSNPPK
ncbi:MAG: hypothetical protein SXG53_13730 [Pseudomonadota bacterium]|nr:hypothetical protein [Pseudomonadota bacterium]